MRLTIRQTVRLRDAWIFFLSFLLVFFIEYRLLSTNLKIEPSSKQLTPQKVFPSKAFEEVQIPRIVRELRNKLILAPVNTDIMKPANNDLIPKNEWCLYLNIQDWLTSNSTDSDFSNYLVVQIDDSQPLRISSNQFKGNYLQIKLPELSLGQHHVNVFSSLPWGESIKSPGTYQNITLYRKNILSKRQAISDNPWLTLVSPSTLVRSEPILIDWLSWNTPLKDLLTKNAQWHLRLYINGESFLIDRNIPLWLTGLHKGNNVISIEIVNEQGEVISLNTVNKEIYIDDPYNKTEAYHLSNESSKLLRRELVVNLQVPNPEQNTPIYLANPTITNAMRIVQRNELEKMLFYEEFLNKYSGANTKNETRNSLVIPIKITPIV
ncbi:Proline-rich region (chromatophore) [Paulinella micropora]|uniref:Proline-rich region n=1 Tax=Paulinella micropora TaxID=1928728 RepID=A0A1L5YCB8_9EUKA|nr:Proline-rich region [Paulinella micropora]AQX45094.1 Proline-rich region [Paulinella micropora]BBL86306.1 Proline-rich region [Paulinella micropora]